jgi:hypothetical protein
MSPINEMEEVADQKNAPITIPKRIGAVKIDFR